MDAKSKMSFMNSITPEQDIICSQCGTANTSNYKFCTSCGVKISDAVSLAFAPAGETKELKQKTIQYDEPSAVFAEGLPSWSVEPPQLLVRRR